MEKPHQYATGIEYVLVNGDVVLAQGKHTNARPGKIIYGRREELSALRPSDRAAAEWVIRNGGSVKIAGKLVNTLADLPAGDFRLNGVDLIGTIIDPNDMKKLSGLDELTELFLPGPIFNPGAGSRLDINDQIAAFSGLKKLEKLHFSLHFLTNVNIQDKGLAHLKDLTGLRELRLTQSRIKGPGSLHSSIFESWI